MSALKQPVNIASLPINRRFLHGMKILGRGKNLGIMDFISNWATTGPSENFHADDAFTVENRWIVLHVAFGQVQ
jgi:hypothetical protein